MVSDPENGRTPLPRRIGIAGLILPVGDHSDSEEHVEEYIHPIDDKKHSLGTHVPRE